MATVQILTVTKPGVISYDIFNQGLNQAVPVGTKAVYESVAPASAPYDLVVITDITNGFNKIEYWVFPAGKNPEDYFTIDVVTQNPDGSFNQADQWKLPKWLYTNGVVDKLGPGLIDPEWWAKNKWWILAIAGLTAIILLDNQKKK